MTIRIEPNIPLAVSPKGPAPRYPFRRMSVGDSFLVDETPERVRGAASNCGKRYGMRFRIRSVEGGVRVWRIE